MLKIFTSNLDVMLVRLLYDRTTTAMKIEVVVYVPYLMGGFRILLIVGRSSYEAEFLNSIRTNDDK